ncbi:uncharacterized protein LOC133708386 [Rosa rugosa]|uniref:uncharacterized protein LOC133708386 n=1 Tax=Rosa rugosa TaxID=74645 RepID=UPI002B40FCF7|nr:uncharacterized protein LOC133708386 [Rosa rugosa]XP_061989830.1 uncharacterized protein LOC133708386 [Rosa rugosa]XP_061989831.1 uncharacterized protein LOC133708386 [Rosa rugosa]
MEESNCNQYSCLSNSSTILCTCSIIFFSTKKLYKLYKILYNGITPAATRGQFFLVIYKSPVTVTTVHKGRKRRFSRCLPLVSGSPFTTPIVFFSGTPIYFSISHLLFCYFQSNQTRFRESRADKVAGVGKRRGEIQDCGRPVEEDSELDKSIPKPTSAVGKSLPGVELLNMKFLDWYLKIAFGSALIGASMEFFMIKTGFYDKVTVLESEKRAWENSPEAQAVRESLNPWRNRDVEAKKES